MKRQSKLKKSVMASTAAMALMISSAGIYPAFSDDCSDDIAKVEAALGTADISAEDLAKVQTGHASAVAKQAGGDSAGCVADLTEAKSILNLE